MAGSPQARIVLVFDPAAVPIVGHVHRESALPQPFSGWMGLFSVLEQELRALRRSGVADSTAMPGEPEHTDKFGETPDGQKGDAVAFKD